MSEKKKKSGFSALNEPAPVQPSRATDKVESGRDYKWLDNPNDPPKTRVEYALRRNGIMIVSVGLAAILVLMTVHTNSERSQTLDRQEAKIVSLEQAKKTTEGERTRSYEEITQDATGGIVAETRKKNDEVARGLFSSVFNWDGLPAYLEARGQVMRTYGLAEDSEFMRNIMPGEIEGVARKAPSGKTYYSNSTDLNSTFDGIDTVVTKVNGDVYSYWALVSARVQSDSGQTSSPMYLTATYDVIDGKIVNLNATTAPSGLETTS